MRKATGTEIYICDYHKDGELHSLSYTDSH